MKFKAIKAAAAALSALSLAACADDAPQQRAADDDARPAERTERTAREDRTETRRAAARADRNGDRDRNSDGLVRYHADPYPSTYTPAASETVLIRDATVFDGIGGEAQNTDVLMQDGRIAAVGEALDLPEDATEIDGTGRYITPGVIDVHSHLGVFASPSARAHSDGNESVSPVTAEVWAEHGVWPQDPGFDHALAGGVTTLHILPGSANLFGGRGVTLRNVPSRSVQGMKLPDAPYGLKMACGENPKRVYGQRSGPATRMGNMAGYREAWQRAVEYRNSWNRYWDAGDADATAPTRNFELDTLMGVLDGEILIQMHCYRADEMALILDMADEFGYHVHTFHHAVEAYKIADLLEDADTCSAVWADWGGFKMEAYDSIQENLAILHAHGACALIHSDNALNIQRLNQEVAKALGAGRRLGLEISDGEAVSWFTGNAARALGIDDQTGSIEPGQRADVVIWSGHPLSSYAHADHVYIDGALMYDRDDPARRTVRDFSLGQPGQGVQ